MTANNTVQPPVSADDLDLSRFDDDFLSTEAPSRELDDLPDGRYQVSVHKVELTRSHTSGNPMLRWTLKVLNGSHVGRLLWRNNVIGSRENLRFLKGDLLTCGLELAKLSDLPKRLEELLDVKLDVTKKTKGENQNVYFNRRIVLMEDVPAAGDASIPF